MYEKFTEADFKVCQGYLVGYLAIKSGHRPSVFRNMKYHEALDPDVVEKGMKFVVNVSHN